MVMMAVVVVTALVAVNPGAQIKNFSHSLITDEFLDILKIDADIFCLISLDQVLLETFLMIFA